MKEEASRIPPPSSFLAEVIIDDWLFMYTRVYGRAL